MPYKFQESFSITVPQPSSAASSAKLMQKAEIFREEIICYIVTEVPFKERML
jgi:hypothetical protein